LESNELRKVGLKVTLPRVKILDIMEGGGSRHQRGTISKGGILSLSSTRAATMTIFCA
jgi:Fe2+ or Zn2+ uptake regulation protein